MKAHGKVQFLKLSDWCLNSKAFILAVIAGLAMHLPNSAMATINANKFSAELLQVYTEQSSAEALIYAKGQANLLGAEMFLTKNARAQFVYDSLRLHAKRQQAGIRQALDQMGIRYRPLYLINAISVPELPLEAAQVLAQRDDVQMLRSNMVFAMQTPPAQTSAPLINDLETPDSDSREIAPNIIAMGADRVWRDLKRTGEGVVVAGQDTGYAWQHPAIRNQYRGNSGMRISHDYNWHDGVRGSIGGQPGRSNCEFNSTSPCDDNGHGTHTMGTIVGDDGGANRIGVAPGAKWIGCRNMDRGLGNVASYTECFQFFLAPFPVGANPEQDGRPEFAPDVINNSWGCPSQEGCRGGEFLTAIQAMRAAGILMVASAGNDGSGCGSVNAPPAMYSGELISVGAFDTRDNDIADFSSRGPSTWKGGVGIDIAAPGANIRSAVPGGGSRTNPLYDWKSGTSMAGPHVVGAVALLWSAQPALKNQVAATIERIQSRAVARATRQNCGSFLGSQRPNAVFGYGLLDAFELAK